MREVFLAFGLAIVLIPVVLFSTNRIYGNSVTGIMGKLTGVMNLFYCALFFAVGKLGAIHIVWALPVAYASAHIVNRIMKKIVKDPLEEAIKNLDMLADGNLNISINKSLALKKHDIGTLVRSMLKLTEKLKHVVGGVAKNADNLSMFSAQMEATSKQLSEGSSQQATSTEEVSSSMEQMVSNINHNTENARQTENIASLVATSGEKVRKASNESI